MSNFKEDILEELNGAEIEALEVWPIDTWDDDDPRRKIEGYVSIDDMDYDYDSSYGCQDCHYITLWTKDHVYFVHEYDGATWTNSVERNPNHEVS